MCQNHTLLDGNKRLAWAAAVTFPALNGHPVPDVDVDAAEAFMLAVAGGKLTDVSEIEQALRDLYPPQPAEPDRRSRSESQLQAPEMNGLKSRLLDPATRVIRASRATGVARHRIGCATPNCAINPGTSTRPNGQ